MYKKYHADLNIISQEKKTSLGEFRTQLDEKFELSQEKLKAERKAIHNQLPE